MSSNARKAPAPCRWPGGRVPVRALLARRRPDRPQLGRAHAAADRLGPARQGSNCASLRTCSTARAAPGSSGWCSFTIRRCRARPAARGLKDAAALQSGAACARRRTRHPWPQPSQHAGLLQPSAAGAPIPIVGVPLPRSAVPHKARAAGPLQSLSHRRAALARRARRAAALCRLPTAPSAKLERRTAARGISKRHV